MLSAADAEAKGPVQVICFLDTNVVIAFIKGQPAVRARRQRAATKGVSIALSSVVLFELWCESPAANDRGGMPSSCASLWPAFRELFRSTRKMPRQRVIRASQLRSRERRSVPMIC